MNPHALNCTTSEGSAICLHMLYMLWCIHIWTQSTGILNLSTQLSNCSECSGIQGGKTQYRKTHSLILPHCCNSRSKIAMIPTKGGTGMKMKIQVGYRASTTFCFWVRSGTSLCKVKLYQKTLTSLAKWFIDTKGNEYVYTKTSSFSWPQNSSVSLSNDELQITQYCLWGWQVPQLTQYPTHFGLGIGEQIPVLPGWIKLPIHP